MTFITPKYKLLMLFLLILTYGLLFYFSINLQFRIDFMTFYSSAWNYVQKLNPYSLVTSAYLPTPTRLPANLNPPIFILLTQPLAWLSYQHAVAIWTVLSFILGIAGASMAFRIAFPEVFFRKNLLVLLTAYLLLFSTLENAIIGQVGTVLLFFIISAYYLYLQKYDVLAGILWGIIIAIKLFPALLCFFVWQQKRYKTLLTIAVTTLLLWLVPVLLNGPDDTRHYLNMLSRVLWYGDSWNASIYGFLFRFLVNPKLAQNLLMVRFLYGLIFTGLLIWYLRKISKDAHAENHQAFSLTLAMMLLLSPFGWMYYFPLLILPLALCWKLYIQTTRPNPVMAFLWLVSLALLNFPAGYVENQNMGNFFSTITFYSSYFYGLLILIFLLAKAMTMATDRQTVFLTESCQYWQPWLVVQLIGLSVPLGYFILHLPWS